MTSSDHDSRLSALEARVDALIRGLGALAPQDRQRDVEGGYRLALSTYAEGERSIEDPQRVSCPYVGLLGEAWRLGREAAEARERILDLEAGIEAFDDAATEAERRCRAAVAHAEALDATGDASRLLAEAERRAQLELIEAASIGQESDAADPVVAAGLCPHEEGPLRAAWLTGWVVMDAKRERDEAVAVLRGFCAARRIWTAAEVGPLWAEAERVVAKHGGQP